MTTALDTARRIVIKIGSALLVDRQDGLRQDWLNALCDDIATLVGEGRQVLLVSSGAIALGRNVLGLPAGPLRLDESQAAAAVGQIELGRAWSEALRKRGLSAGQILLTLKDTEGQASRRSYLNARDTIERLLGFGAIPVINENDTVATSEIQYGDNDRLAARVATMMTADLLILLSDVDGLYTAPPANNPEAQLLRHVPEITPAIEKMAGSAGSELSRGGMVTKIEAGKIATRSGTAMVITSGTRLNPIAALRAGENATWFDPAPTNASARKTWIAGQLKTAGSLTIDDGAARALANGKSLLPAGVRDVEGTFERGDTVSLKALDGTLLGHGLVGYNSEEARSIAGLRSDEVSSVLGYKGRATMVHRDDMALIASGDKKKAG